MDLGAILQGVTIILLAGGVVALLKLSIDLTDFKRALNEHCERCQERWEGHGRTHEHVTGADSEARREVISRLSLLERMIWSHHPERR